MKAAKLVESAREAAEVRTHQTDPNVVALNVERIRTWVNVFFWVGITLGLTFTMANVQGFAAGGVPKFSIQWWIAWLLDPMVSLPLLGVLIGEQVLTRYNVKSGAWVHVVKWVTLSCTYAMNTWQAWAAQDPAKILLHSVPPLVVVCAAEGLTDLRHRITEAVTKAVEGAAGDRSQAHKQAAPEAVPGPDASGPQAHEEMGLKTAPETASGPSENRPQAHTETGPKSAPGPDVDGPEDGPQAYEEMDPARPKRRTQARPKVATKGVTEDQWADRIRQTIADHPGINSKPSAVLSAMGVPEADRSKIGTSGVFKRAMTAVREELASA